MIGANEQAFVEKYSNETVGGWVVSTMSSVSPVICDAADWEFSARKNECDDV